jgi:ATP synthase protein I
MGDEGTRFAAQIAAKSSLKLASQRATPAGALAGIGMLGVIGWSVAVPTVLGAFLGLWLDNHHRGAHSWTLALLVAGLTLGCANAWLWVSRQAAASAPRAGDHDD